MLRSGDTSPAEGPQQPLLRELERLRQEKECLADQIKLLVQIEHRLHQSQLAADRHLRRIQALNRFALAASSSTDADAILELAVELLLSLFPYEQGASFAVGEDGVLRISGLVAVPGREAVGRQAAAQPPESTVVELLDGFSADPYSWRGTPTEEHPSGLLALTRSFVEAFDPDGSTPAPDAAWLCMPLRVHPDRFVGILLLRKPQAAVLSHHENLPAAVDRPYLRLVATHIAAAVQSALLHAEVRHQASELAVKMEVLEESARQLARANAALEQEVAERRRLEEELRELANVKKKFASIVVQAEEQERSRVSRELHDAVGQVLVAIKMDAHWIALHADDSSEVAPLAAQLAERAGSTIVAIRSIVHNLRPPVLDDLGVGTALRAYAQDICRLSGMQCHVHVTEDPQDLPPEMATAIYRIAQEGINNAVRHSAGTLVEVSLRDTGSAMVLTVRDDGQGLPADRIYAPGSVGLMGVRERAALLGGQVSIVSSEGNGTTITVRIPYD